MPNSHECNDYVLHAKKLLESMTNLKNMVYEQEQAMLENQRMREQGARPGTYEDEVSMYGDEMKAHGGYGDGNKKRRGVSSLIHTISSHLFSDQRFREQHRQDAVTAAIEKKLRNGGEVQMVHAHCAMLVDCTTPSSHGKTIKSRAKEATVLPV